jgi:cytochrome oxidase Cu insertion factor (SCO1/SenC/PrrC family)
MTTNPPASCDTVSPPGGGGSAGPQGQPGRKLRGLPLALTALALLVVGVVTAVVTFAIRGPGTAAPNLPRPSGIPATISTSLANLMQLGPLDHAAAPGFTLTDQAGRTLSLSSLRGKVVVLEFMDPHCTDICPIVSQEYVDAYHDLGPVASKVVFAAVNVNQYFHSVANVATFSREHGLTAIPDWHFFTGPVAELRSVWGNYNITVEAPNPKGDIVHTSAIYFIDARGREAFLAMPMVDHTSKGTAFLPAGQMAAWGRGIALVARSLAG